MQTVLGSRLEYQLPGTKKVLEIKITLFNFLLTLERGMYISYCLNVGPANPVFSLYFGHPYDNNTELEKCLLLFLKRQMLINYCSKSDKFLFPVKKQVG
jgi:hypothetical protein